MTDSCPACGQAHEWDAAQDCYAFQTASRYHDVQTVKANGNRIELEVHVCHCGGVVAVTVRDEKMGSTLYTPDQARL